MIELEHPVLFAHRGASAHAPENTLAAFEMARKHGAKAVELDAKLTADGHVVVIHDPTVERTTGARGSVGQMTLAQLKELDAGRFFSSRFAGERIPTLDEVFAAVGKRLFINVELTNYATPTDDLTPKVVELVRCHGLEEWVMFSSFHPLNLWRARRLLPRVRRGFLTQPGAVWSLLYPLVCRLLSPEYVHPHYSDVNMDFLRAQRRAGRGVNVWTVNQPEEMRRLFDLGVDGIFTDDPLQARHVLEVR